MTRAGDILFIDTKSRKAIESAARWLYNQATGYEYDNAPDLVRAEWDAKGSDLLEHMAAGA